VLRADDSTYWEVETLDKEALAELEAVLPPANAG
jgi:hypothetical protein